MKRLKITGIAALAVLMCSGSFASYAHAEGMYKPNRKVVEPTREQIEELGFTGILPQDRFWFSVINDRTVPDGFLVFRVATPSPVDGCVKMMNYEATPEIQGVVLILDVKFPIILPDYKNVRQENCKKSNSAYVDTLIDRNELIDKGVNQFRIRTKYGVTNFDLDVTPHKIRFIPKEKTKYLTSEYWTLPRNAVVLSVPMFNDDLMNSSAQLQQLARVAYSRGLVPIEEDMPDYIPSTPRQNRFYFLDTKGDVLDLLENGGGAVSVGQLNKAEPYYGPNGKYDKIIPVDVMASIPDVND